MIALSSLRTALGAALLCLSSPAVAAAEPAPHLCEAMAAQAGAEAGLPEGLLPAIARVESGKRTDDGVRAWPWTLNQGGDGSYHASMAAALVQLDRILAAGIRNVDLGCMQLNWRWHGAAFPDAATMMDPQANTRYAAAFLKDLHAQHGSWTKAVAHYHSADPARGTAYAARVAQVLERIGTTTIPEGMTTGTPRTTPCAEAAGAEAEPQAGAGAMAAAGCPRLRGLLLAAGGSLLAKGAGGDLRQAPGSGDAAVTPRYLR